MLVQTGKVLSSSSYVLGHVGLADLSVWAERRARTTVLSDWYRHDIQPIQRDHLSPCKVNKWKRMTEYFAILNGVYSVVW